MTTSFKSGLVSSLAGLLVTITSLAADANEYADAPPAPAGYSSYTALKLAYAVGMVKLIEEPKSVPETITLHKDIEYSNVEGHSLKLDLFVPKNIQKDTPCLVFIHGGGWKKGKKENYLRYNIDFAERGYITASISYRLSGVAKFPAAVIDAKNAIRWIRANAGDYQIDPEQIVAIGGSAGGHLSLMVGHADDTGFESEEKYKDVSSEVKAVVNFYGVADMTTPTAIKAHQVLSFMGKNYAEAEDDYKLASPMTHLKVDGPPTLSFHGSIDELVPVSQSEILHQRLDELGVENYLDVIQGWPHTMDANVDVNKRCQYIMHEFFKKHVPLSN